MNNLCFRTVVLAINSAEVQYCRRKTRNCSAVPQSYQKLALLNRTLFGAVELTLNSAEVQHCRQKNERIFNSANNHQKLALMNNLCIGTVVLAINSAEKKTIAAVKKIRLSSAQKLSKVVIVEKHSFRHRCTSTHKPKYNIAAEKKLFPTVPLIIKL